MPRKNSTTRSVGDDITASRLNDINEDFDDLYSNGPDRLRVYNAVSWTPLRIDISAGAYYIWSTSGVYWWWTDIVVTNAATNYVMIDSAWSITISTSARTAWLWRLAQVVCAGGAVTDIILRNNMVFGGAALDMTALTEDTAPDEDNDFLFGYDTSAWLNKKVKPKNLNIRPFLEYTAWENLVAWNPVRYWLSWSWQTITVAWNGNSFDIAWATSDAWGVWQSFTLSNAWNVISISVRMRKWWTPTWTLTAYIYNPWDLTNALFISTNTISESALTWSFTQQTFNFSNYLPAWVYRVRIWTSRAVDAINKAQIEYNWSNVYAWWDIYIINNVNSRTLVTSPNRDLRFVLTVNATWETTTSIYKTTASDIYKASFIWFSRETTSLWQTAKVDTIVSRQQSWLTAFSDYFLWNTAWTISTSAWTVSKKVWKALSATEIAINYNPA